MTDEKFPSQLAERFQVRLPDGMRDRLRDAAAANNRSMNAEIIDRLERSFSLEFSDFAMAAWADGMKKHMAHTGDMTSAILAMQGGRFVWIDQGGSTLRSDNSELLNEAIVALEEKRAEGRSE